MPTHLKKITILLFFTTVAAELLYGQDSIWQIPFSPKQIEVDGELDDWRTCSEISFENFVKTFKTVPEISYVDALYEDLDFESFIPVSPNKIMVKAFWNLNNLNLAFQISDRHLFAQFQHHSRKSNINNNDAVEIYVDTRFDSNRLEMDANDYQFLIDINNNIAFFRGFESLYFEKIDTIVITKDLSANVLVHHAVKINGSLNNFENPDSGFTVEISLPFSSIGLEPFSGLKFRIDLCNNDPDTILIVDPSRYYHYQLTPCINQAGYTDYGYPGYWKQAILTGEPGNLAKLQHSTLENMVVWLGILIVLITVIFAFLYLKIYRYRRLPRASNVPEIKVLFVERSPNIINQLDYNQKILQKLTDFIIENVGEKIQVNELARNAGISVRQLQRITQKEFSCTPGNFVCMIKLNLASEYLKQGKGNVAETAYSYGFSDPAYFSRVFKKHFGMAPASFILQC